MDVSIEILRIAKVIVSHNAEKEIERLFKKFLGDTEFSHKTYAVGGYVRDEIMGHDSKDLDIVIEESGGAEKLAKFLKNKFGDQSSNPYLLGKGYPIWHIAFKDDIELDGDVFKVAGGEIDIADTQKEAFPDPDSRQRVTVPGTLAEDVERRDFTANTLMRDMTDGKLLDMTGKGVSDIKNGIVRANPNAGGDKIFSDDPLRMIRGVRFACKYGWEIEPETIEAIRKNASRISIVSGERIRDELFKICAVGKLYDAIKMFDDLGLLELIFPEIKAMQSVTHDTSRGIHQEGDVYQHTMEVLKNAKRGIVPQFSALLHDIGKPAVREVNGDKIQFLGHEEKGVEDAEKVMRRLVFPSDLMDRINKLIENHMRPHMINNTNAKSKALRKLMRTMDSDEALNDLMDLAEADAMGNLPVDNYIPEMRKKIEEVKQIPVKKQPVLNGREIMELLNLKSGPEVGRYTRFLQDLEDDYASRGIELDKETAIEELKKESLKENVENAVNERKKTVNLSNNSIYQHWKRALGQIMTEQKDIPVGDWGEAARRYLIDTKEPEPKTMADMKYLQSLYKKWKNSQSNS